MLARAAHAAVLAAALAAGLAPAHALAQEVVSIRASVAPGDFGSSSRISRRSVDTYAEVLALTPDQKAMAVSLLEGYDAAASEAQTSLRTQMEDLSRAFRESEDHTIWTERMPKIRREHGDRMKALEKGYFDDLRAVLTTEQQEKWPGVERARRRETVLRTGMGSGENVDLLTIVEALKLEAQARAALAETLGDYEVELDRALASKQREQEQASPFEPGRPIDPEAMRERIQKAREAGQRVKEVNQKHARRIEALLPDGKRDEFLKAFRAASFPRVYRPSAVTKRLDAAAGLADLDASQKESIQLLRESYLRDLAPVNDRWASAIEESERSGDSGTMAMPGGGTVQVAFSNREEGPVADARKARRELDEKFRDRLDSILSKEQRERLPKEPTPTEGGELFGAGPVMINRIEQDRR